jgi:hypothetical protein
MMSIFVVEATCDQNDAVQTLAASNADPPNQGLFATKLLLHLASPAPHSTGDRYPHFSALTKSVVQKPVVLQPYRKPISWTDVGAAEEVERHCWRRSISFSSFYNKDRRSRYGFTNRQQFGSKAKYGYRATVLAIS